MSVQRTRSPIQKWLSNQQTHEKFVQLIKINWQNNDKQTFYQTGANKTK